MVAFIEEIEKKDPDKQYPKLHVLVATFTEKSLMEMHWKNINIWSVICNIKTN